MPDVRRGKGYGYRTESGKICMIRCFKCGQENWAMAVATGHCALCEYNPNQEELLTHDDDVEEGKDEQPEWPDGGDLFD